MSATLLSQEESKAINAALFEKLSSRDPGMEKEALDAVNDFTRTKMREDGFFRRIMPPIPITNDELDRQVSTDKPVKIVDKEPDSPAAISIPFGTLPINEYILGNRYVVTFSRIATPRFTKDVDELRTWQMDIRQVLSDNAIKDMLAEEDGKFITAVNVAVGSVNSASSISGQVQHKSIAGGITRDTLWDAMKIMPALNANLETHTVLCNSLTIKDVCKLGYDEMGGPDISGEIMKAGWTLQEFMGKRWIITIKKDLVANGNLFHFADPKFIGKHYSLEDTTMYIRREAYMLEFFAYQNTGASLGFTSGLARSVHV